MTKERKNPNAKLKTVSNETKEILSELEREYKPAEGSKTDTKAKADKFNAVRPHFTQSTKINPTAT